MGCAIEPRGQGFATCQLRGFARQNDKDVLRYFFSERLVRDETSRYGVDQINMAIEQGSKCFFITTPNPRLDQMTVLGHLFASIAAAQWPGADIFYVYIWSFLAPGTRGTCLCPSAFAGSSRCLRRSGVDCLVNNCECRLISRYE